MPTLDLDIETKRLIRRIAKDYPKAVRRRLRFALEATARKVQDDARANVPVDTSNLQSSIQVDLSDIDDLKARVGSGLEYAAIIEYGFTGTQEVDAHKRTITQAFGRKIPETVVSMRAHTRQVDRKGTFYLTKAAASQLKPHRKRVAKSVQLAGKDTAD